MYKFNNNGFKIITLSSLIILMMLSLSCKKDTVTPYDGKTGISFEDGLADKGQYSKEIFFNFDSAGAMRVLQIPVTATGYTTSFNRQIAVQIDTGLSSHLPAGTYDLLNQYSILVADASSGVIGVGIKKPPVTNLDTCKLVLKIVPNNYFSTVISDGRYCTITYTNRIYKPRYWDSRYDTYYGLFSAAKFKFIHTYLLSTAGGTPDHSDYASLDQFSKRFGTPVLTTLLGFSQMFQDAYNAYLLGGGSPIIDENTGREISFKTF